MAVSPLFKPSTRITVSGVTPFIPDELLKKELTRSQHTHTLCIKTFMYLNDPSQTLEVLFQGKA